jgi:hypothetical protein
MPRPARRAPSPTCHSPATHPETLGTRAVLGGFESRMERRTAPEGAPPRARDSDARGGRGLTPPRGTSSKEGAYAEPASCPAGRSDRGSESPGRVRAVGAGHTPPTNSRARTSASSLCSSRRTKLRANSKPIPRGRPRGACVGGRAHRLPDRAHSTASEGRPCRPRRPARSRRRRCPSGRSWPADPPE